MSPRLLDDWRHRPTQRRAWALALPMIVSNISIPLVALVDTAVAGHLPHSRQLAAVAVGAAVFSMLAWVFGFLRMGTTGFAAQAAGRSDGDTLRRVLVQALLLAAGLGTAMAIVAWPLLPGLLVLMKASPELHELALTYLHIRLPALPAVLANYALAGWFLGAQNARVAFLMLLATNLVNVALNLLLVLVVHMGVDGIALASLVAAWSGTAVGLACIPRQLRRHPGRMDWPGLRGWLHWRPLLSVNRDIFLRSLALQGVFFAVTVLGTRLGADVVAANALLMNGLMLASFALDGLANAVEAMSGHAIGARDRTGLRRALVVCGGWSLLGALAFAAALGWGGHLFVDMQTSIASVRRVAYAHLGWLALLPLAAVGGFFFDGLFVGATRARAMRDCMLVAAAGFAVMAAGLIGPFGNHGLWAAFLGFMLLRAASMGWSARRISRRDGWIAPATDTP